MLTAFLSQEKTSASLIVPDINILIQSKSSYNISLSTLFCKYQKLNTLQTEMENKIFRQ